MMWEEVKGEGDEGDYFHGHHYHNDDGVNDKRCLEAAKALCMRDRKEVRKN